MWHSTRLFTQLNTCSRLWRIYTRRLQTTVTDKVKMVLNSAFFLRFSITHRTCEVVTKLNFTFGSFFFSRGLWATVNKLQATLISGPNNIQYLSRLNVAARLQELLKQTCRKKNDLFSCVFCFSGGKGMFLGLSEVEAFIVEIYLLNIIVLRYRIWCRAH